MLKVRVGDQGAVDQARPQRIGAGKLKRRWRAIGLCEIAVKRQVRRELVGRANHGIEMGVSVITVERGVVAKFVRQIDLGEVEAPTGSDREA